MSSYIKRVINSEKTGRQDIMNTFFTFVRHGETDANRNGILQGQKEYPLVSVKNEVI